MICYDAPRTPEELWDSKTVTAPFMGALSFENVSAAPEPGVVLMKANLCWALGNKGMGNALIAADFLDKSLQTEASFLSARAYLFD